MKKIFSIFSIIFLFSCASVESTLQQNGNAQEILDGLASKELRKGKIFVLSNIQDIGLKNVRVNDEVVQMRDKEIQAFDLVEGENSIYSFLEIFDDEVYNCNVEQYFFNTNDFIDMETHYFMIIEIAGKEFIGRQVDCFKDVHIKEEAFFYFIDNPRSIFKKDWILN